MIDCGSQIILCDLPVRLDTYKGCAHQCAYCFTKRKYDLADIRPEGGIKAVDKWCRGERPAKLKWIDWSIPLHIGGMSDPLQPIEQTHRATMPVLEVLHKYRYPYVISTKGRLLADHNYVEVISTSRAVVQVSHVSPAYDKYEPGAPPYDERLDIIHTIARRALRTVVRVQPYIPGITPDILAAIPKYQAAGVWGIVVEGIKYHRKVKGTTRWFGDYVYPVSRLRRDFASIRDAAHAAGLVFMCGENRLRSMSDYLCCCGIDGLPDFIPNRANLNHARLNPEGIHYTPAMMAPDTAGVFADIYQSPVVSRNLRGMSYRDAMELIIRSRMGVAVS